MSTIGYRNIGLSEYDLMRFDGLMKSKKSYLARQGLYTTDKPVFCVFGSCPG